VLNSKSSPVTILLPLYNGAPYLKKSIDNLLLTLRSADEILIIDDGSTDLSSSDVKMLEKIDSRIRLERCEHSGLVKTLNHGISRASNELIARADIDDLYKANRLESQSDFLANNGDVAAVFSDYQFISDSGKSFGTLYGGVFPEITKLSLINSQRTAHPSVMFRRAAVLESGMYQESDFPAEDLALWMRMANRNKIASIPETLLYYRLHSKSVSVNFRGKMLQKRSHLINQFAESLDVDEIYGNLNLHVQNYEDLTHASKRVTLLIYDLITAMQLKKELHISSLAKTISALLPPSRMLGTSELLLEKIRRKRLKTKF
jgi:glycosyltransferase involved in cell wall biosynthesis